MLKILLFSCLILFPLFADAQDIFGDKKHSVSLGTGSTLFNVSYKYQIKRVGIEAEIGGGWIGYWGFVTSTQLRMNYYIPVNKNKSFMILLAAGPRYEFLGASHNSEYITYSHGPNVLSGIEKFFPKHGISISFTESFYYFIGGDDSHNRSFKWALLNFKLRKNF